MMNRLNKLAVLIVILLAVAGGIVLAQEAGLGQHKKTPVATITLNYPGLPDTQGLSVKFNNNSVGTDSNTYQVASGSYRIDITKPGYQPFSTSLTANASQTYVVNAQLRLSAAPAPITSIQQLNVSGIDPAQVSIVSVNYFYNNTWAVVVASAFGSNAVIVAQYNVSSGSWGAALGPGTSFYPADVQSLPEQVSGYLSANNYVNQGG